MNAHLAGRCVGCLRTIADELDHYRQLLMDSRAEVHFMSGEARALANTLEAYALRGTEAGE